MKFYCDACNTKYAISDEKVHGKVLKVRCKNCGNVITVREAVAPIGSAHETDPTISTPTHIPSADDLAVPTTQWYYALNGQTFGPFTLDGLRRKYATAEIGDATYVWHERLGSWKPVASEAAFADALAMGHTIVPSRKTLGFTGPVEAIRVVHGGPSKERAGVVPNRAHAQPRETKPPAKPASALQPKPAAAAAPLPQSAVLRPPARKAAPPPKSPRRPEPKAAPTPEARPLNDARQGSLDRLRQKLDSSLGAPEESLDAVPLPQPVGAEAIFTYAAGIVPASAESSQDLRAALANDAVDFDLPPHAKHQTKPSPSSTSDILDRVIGPTSEPPSEASEVDDSGVIPFFPESPRVPPKIRGATGQEATSESLLVDVGQMNRARGKRNAATAAVGVLVVFVVAAVGVNMMLLRDPPRGSEATPVSTQPKHKDELVAPTYKPEELAKIGTLDLEDELLFSEDEAEFEDEPPLVVPPVGAVISGAPAVKKPVRPKKPVAVLKETTEPVDVVPAVPVDPLAALLAPRAHRKTEIRAPEDPLLARVSHGLTKDQARRGFQRVKKSIRDCRERHNRYNAKLDAGKLKISVTVEPTGAVSTFTLNPPSVQNTEFHACMNSHQGRWTFAKFEGKAVVINTSIIIQ